MNDSPKSGRRLMQSVILVNLFILLGAVALQLVRTRLLPSSVSMPILLVVFAILLYNGYRRFRILFGLLHLAAAVSLLIAAFARAPLGSAALWFYVAAALGLTYCAWVILLSQQSRSFLEVREQWLRSQRTR